MAKTPAIDLLSVITAHFLNFFSRKRIEISIHEETSVICMDGVHPLVISLMPQFPTGKYWEWATTYVSLVQFDSRKWTLAALEVKSAFQPEYGARRRGKRARDSQSQAKKGPTHRKPNTFAAGNTHLSLSLSPSPSLRLRRRLGVCHFANFIGTVV